MSRFHLKISCHPKNQNDLKLDEEGKSIDDNTEMIEKLGLSDKDFKQPLKK